MRALLLSLLVATAGCVGSGEPPTARGVDPPAPAPPSLPLCAVNTTSAPGAPPAQALAITPSEPVGPDAACAAPSPGGVPAPVLPVGRAWTYQAKQLYNPDAEFSVVVAEAGPEGYLFAGGAEDDLVYHALWNSEWHGEHGPDLNPTEARFRAFDFPLADGKSWDYVEGLRVTARAAEVATPRGREPGFVVEGANERYHLRYEYAPSVGYYVSYLFEVGDLVTEELRLTRVAEGVTEWVWYELGPLTIVPQPHEPQAFEVPAGYDHVIVSAGGAGGGRASIVPPGGQAWQAEFGAEERWDHAMLPPAEGRWVASVQGKPLVRPPVDPPADAPKVPVGWAYMHAAPVTWVRA